jgi:hypothetical protein
MRSAVAWLWARAEGRSFRLVLREAYSLMLAGLTIGMGLELWLGLAAAALLYGLKPYDPLALAGLSLLWQQWVSRRATDPYYVPRVLLSHGRFARGIVYSLNRTDVPKKAEQNDNEHLSPSIFSGDIIGDSRRPALS